jgi:hypothetical protein
VTLFSFVSAFSAHPVVRRTSRTSPLWIPQRHANGFARPTFGSEGLVRLTEWQRRRKGSRESMNPNRGTHRSSGNSCSASPRADGAQYFLNPLFGTGAMRIVSGGSSGLDVRSAREFLRWYMEPHDHLENAPRSLRRKVRPERDVIPVSPLSSPMLSWSNDEADPSLKAFPSPILINALPRLGASPALNLSSKFQPVTDENQAARSTMIRSCT